MDARSDRSLTHHEGYRLSSSLPQQSWARPSASYPSPAAAAPVSSPARPRNTPAVDESTLAHRTTALRQLNGTPKPLSRNHRQNRSIGSRSTLASQPVLVRSYSGEADDNKTRPSSSTMASGPFSFTSGSRGQQTPPELPSVQDFSIEGILSAIEPDIRSTLDSIAEICGRSKLSLANEYGSHIAPLGEIRAQPGGLVTVEEASSSSERLADDNVVIVDDDTSFLDGRNNYSHPAYGFLENLRNTAHAMGYQANMPPSVGDTASMQAQPDTPRSVAIADPVLDMDTQAQPVQVTHEHSPHSRASSRALLRNRRAAAQSQLGDILTPAVVSEVHIDVRANQPTWPLTPPATPGVPHHDGVDSDSHALVPEHDCSQDAMDKRSLLADLQGLLSWLKNYAQGKPSSAAEAPLHSAETSLRAMLQRHDLHENGQHATTYSH
ncbi:hypothetical protein C8Q69DRAFT_143076 [Paecilomyces variotii]|uniref:Uncharacterized protein n=1 Tax=Byssochlamys spectabilis TaxID=264951 RepID=A0A443I0N8_BYSSP|nr:hypothetical protein C8Q69DRAFT_143076 [Paecilomyces variotii]KAJ9244002.1 hypothetical protein DTO169E5_1990 [Paecilomyces variotii]KAJ9365149.1 hypothetical protein DTO280E4_804 [Paecilomyces variotii]KAJ9385922.1 hypothetical protein DTO063F5_3886 [Paecilomyces variotii]RWQ97624.1 hypothetical protein C8Q69DRAFT_143076 [Paecilomyces variotii]